MESLAMTLNNLSLKVTSVIWNLSKCHTSKSTAYISKNLFTHEPESILGLLF